MSKSVRHASKTDKICSCLTKVTQILVRMSDGFLKLGFRKMCQLFASSAYMSSWKSSKEGDLPLCILPKREILPETLPQHLFCPGISNSSWIFFNMGTYSLFLVAYNSLYDAKIFLHCAWWTLCWLNNAFLLENSRKFTLFNGKMICRRWGQKEGVFQF